MKQAISDHKSDIDVRGEHCGLAASRRTGRDRDTHSVCANFGHSRQCVNYLHNLSALNSRHLEDKHLTAIKLIDLESNVGKWEHSI